MMVTLCLALLAAGAPDAGTHPSLLKGKMSQKPVDVTAEKLEVRVKENRAIYSGNATAVRETTTMKCDKMTVEFLPGGTDVTRIFSEGHCHAVDGDREATGDTVEYLNDTGLVIVRGNPHAKQGAREVTGDEVRFTTGDERCVVTKAKSRGEQTTDKGPQLVTIDADQLELFQNQATAVWTGHVEAHRGETKLVGPEMTALWDEKGVVTQVEAHHGIEGTEGEKWVSGKDAVYSTKTGILILTGNPQAKQGGSRMKGTRIKFTSGTELLEVENAVTLLQVDKKKPTEKKK